MKKTIKFNDIKMEVKKPILNLLSVGDILTIGEIKNKYPFPDVTSPEFFTPHHQYNVGDVVVYNGSRHTWTKDHTNLTLVVTSVKINWLTKSKGNKVEQELEIGYWVEPKDANYKSKLGSVYYNECELGNAAPYWVISFSNDHSDSTPAIHQLDYFSYIEKYKKTWKNSRLIFDSKEKAEKVANFFAKYTIEQMMRMVESYEEQVNHYEKVDES